MLLKGTLAKINKEYERRLLSGGGIGVNAKAIPRPANVLPLLPMEQGIPASDILGYGGALFVRNAYRAVLGRDPDPAGGMHYQEALQRRRLSKLGVLVRLRFSREGRSKGRPVPRLIPRYLASLGYRVPIAGRIIRAITLLWNARQILKNIEDLRDETNERFENIRQYKHYLADAIQENINRLCKNLRRTNHAIGRHDAVLESITERLNYLEVQAEHTGEELNSLKKDSLNLRSQVVNTEEWKVKLHNQISNLRGELQREAARLEEQSKSINNIQEMLRNESTRREQLNQRCDDFDERLSQDYQLILEDMMSLRSLIRQHNGRFDDIIDSVTQPERRKVGLEVDIEYDFQRCEDIEFSDWVEIQPPDYLQQAVDESPLELSRGTVISNQDVYYHLFENVFYDSATVKEKQKRYIPYLPERVHSGQSRLLDIGCGRGEFLENVREAGIEAIGLDIDDVEIKVAEGKGLDVIRQDALEFLNAQAAESFGTVSAFQVIEHLNTQYLSKLILVLERVLEPGGAVLLETVNPHCTIGFSSFYMDETHVKPLPSERLTFLLQWAGFIDINLLYSMPVSRHLRTTELKQNYHDYCLIGHKRGS